MQETKGSPRLGTSSPLHRLLFKCMGPHPTEPLPGPWSYLPLLLTKTYVVFYYGKF